MSPGERNSLTGTERRVDRKDMSTYQATTRRVGAVTMDGVECAIWLGKDVPKNLPREGNGVAPPRVEAGDIREDVDLPDGVLDRSTGDIQQSEKQPLKPQERAG